MLTILLTLLLGTNLGILLTLTVLFWLVKVNCPQCQKPKPLREIILFSWKSRQITGQKCRPCRRKSQYELL